MSALELQQALEAILLKGGGALSHLHHRFTTRQVTTCNYLRKKEVMIGHDYKTSQSRIMRL